MGNINGSVGRNGRNSPADVKTVQQLLNRHLTTIAPRAALKDDGKAGNLTIGAIEAFQRNVVGMRQADGRVDPGGRTFTALARSNETSLSLPTAGRTSRSPLPSFNLGVFFAQLDRHPELKDGRVVYFDGRQLHVLREGPPYCAPGLKAVVIREPVEKAALAEPEAAATRDGKLLAELLGTGLGCSAAILGWTVATTSTGAAPLTGGTSMFIAYLAIGATAASAAQCGVGLVRIGMETFAPASLDALDQEEWYRKTALALDGISLAGAATATTATIRLVLHLRATTGKSLIQVLKGLSRQERKRLAEETVRVNHPGISNSQLKSLVRAGVYPRRFTPLQISESVQRHIKNAAGAAASFGGSAISGAVRDAGELIVGIASSIETYR